MIVIELLAVLISLWGMCCVSFDDKKTQVIGFMLWLVSNATWAYIAWTSKDWLMLAQFCAFFLFSGYAIYQRRREF